MTALPNTTKSRLKKIPQVPGVVWEGDRRALGSMASHLDLGLSDDGECILWVDGSEGAVLAMDVVGEDMGIEAVVRTLLRAIESPHHPGQPHRPQKIVVRDREIQFFLRGALQGLEINIEYSPQLPLIDRLFESFGEVDGDEVSALPSIYQDGIKDVASKIWDNAPWELLADSDILRVELKNCQIDEVYLCIMGMMSAEFGVLLYRSLDSLKQFRAAALGENQSPAELEKAFLAQDCWFLNYEEADPESKWIAAEEVEPFFGSLHPFEGMRPFLDEEEAKIIYAVLETLLRFCDRHRPTLAQEPIDAISKSYRINLPQTDTKKQTIATKISTLPELTEELLELGISDYPDYFDEEIDTSVREDFVPDGSLITLTSLSLEVVKVLKQQRKTYHQSLDISPKGKKLPTIFIQTTRPKAKHLINRIKDAGGLKSVCFNLGQNSFSGDSFHLGMLQTGDDELHIFAEYSQEVVEHMEIVEEWQHSCQKTKGYCLLVIAMGATGNNRGNPQLKDMLALYEVKSIDGADIGMGVLELMPNFER
ncbi:hypothetical protein I4641_16755 [Waterburya agarophytonicola K14]|uniref:Uncharacterized protein n=1 Tax=Waterburya agarophytonicola KI4 TaxID=2874699 RepID=A0A964BVY7_9CYAN|nr:hypothetical protein [Waterburya agarophytonicola]MCC0178625.1 hypothetical protein [Waterburya agarophytonicola KI4]